MTLSILIATIEERKEQFIKLHEFFVKFDIELISLCDNKEMSIGRKRQKLLEMASGEYVVFFDDDDWPSPSYVHDILMALKEKPDCVGFKVNYTKNGINPKTCIMSLNNKAREMKDEVYYRFTNHVTPVKRSIALQAGFSDLRYGEDDYYSNKVIELCKTEVFIDKILYNYRYSDEIAHDEKYGYSEG